jgi:hypothetical protein
MKKGKSKREARALRARLMRGAGERARKNN